MLRLMSLLLAFVASLTTAPIYAQQPTPEQQKFVEQMESLLRDLNPITGDVKIADADAVLHLGDNYYFLETADARRVLIEGWGNPPDTAANVLGMVFPAGKTFLDDSWGAVITFEPVGYVSDEDAQSADYDALMAELQAGEDELNAQRTSQGYPAQHLVGWAQQPSYDARTHSVVWAQNIQFEGQQDNTLNYDVRLLGRRGVLSMNLVTVMSKVPETRRAATKFAQSAEFNSGARYADYQPGADAKAEYGVAGLVAAGVGAAAAKKLGLFGIILAFGKKFIVLIMAGLGLIVTWARKLFGGQPNSQDHYEPEYEPMEMDTDSPARLENTTPAETGDIPPQHLET